jgi:hypothetical protein
MTVQKFLSTAGWIRRLRWNCFLQPHPGPILDSRYVNWQKCGLLDQRRRRKYAESLPYILQPRNLLASQRVADFLRHRPSVTVQWTLIPFVQLLFQWWSLGHAETIKLSTSRSRDFSGMLRHCHRACMQRILSLRKPGLAGVVGQTQHLTEVMCTCRHPDCSAQPASGSPWQQKRRHSCAVMLYKACAPKRFQNQTANL